MIKFRPFLCVLVIFIASNQCAANKITSDPNKANSTALQVKEFADSRLDQKITYQGGYKRLHVVADELSEISGVSIKAGQSKNDWRVRDIPVVVCVKNMPLGNLLKYLAVTAHVQFVSERIGNNPSDKPTYRLYRDKKAQTAIDNAFDARVQANQAMASWAWDTLVQFSKMPDAPLDVPAGDQYMKMDGEQIKLVAKILGSLGSDTKAKAMSGEQVTLKTSTASQKELIRKLFEYACAKPGYGQRLLGMDFNAPIVPQEEYIQNSLLAIKINKQDEKDSSAGFSFMLHGIPIEMKLEDGESRTIQDTWSAAPVELAKALANKKELNLSSPPDSNAVFQDDPSLFPPDCVQLSFKDDWKIPALTEKKAISFPSDKKYPTVAEILVALAKQADVNLICEDFNSHKNACNYPYKTDIESMMSIEAIIKKHKWNWNKWFVDEDSKLLVGQSENWKKRHHTLVPESLLVGIQSKRESNGAELDDIIPVVALSTDQCMEWIDFETPHLFSFDSAAWLLYDSLTSEDKASAKSETGLSLAKFDPQWLSKFFLDAKKEAENGIVSMCVQEEVPGFQKEKAVFSDPKLIAKLVMKVKQKPLESWRTPIQREDGLYEMKEYSPVPGSELKKHSYIIELEYIDDESFAFQSELRDTPFPMYTTEREIELCKKANAVSIDNK